MALARALRSLCTKSKVKIDSRSGYSFRQRLFISSMFILPPPILLLYKKADEKFVAERKNYAEKKATPIGGSWTLLDHHGKRVSNGDYYGSWLLIYFGYCNCPDICPEEVEKLMQTTYLIKDDHSLPNIIPLFITVDPLRDRVPNMAKYVSDFPGLTGLTGTRDQIESIKKSYGAWGGTVEDTKDDEGNYIVDHTIITYLIDPNGVFLDYYGRRKTHEQMDASVRGYMRLWKREHDSPRLFAVTRRAEFFMLEFNSLPGRTAELATYLWDWLKRGGRPQEDHVPTWERAEKNLNVREELKPDQEVPLGPDVPKAESTLDYR